MECLRWVYNRCIVISGKLKSNVDFHCRRSLEGERENDLFQSVFAEPNAKLKCVPKFCCLGGILGAGEGV